MATTWKTAKLKTLLRAMLLMKDEKELAAFLRDLCTIEELEEFGNRFDAARLLDNGLTYREVAKKTGLSTTTVTRIAKWLWNGEGGYLKAIEKMDGKK